MAGKVASFLIRKNNFLLKPKCKNVSSITVPTYLDNCYKYLPVYINKTKVFYINFKYLYKNGIYLEFIDLIIKYTFLLWFIFHFLKFMLKFILRICNSKLKNNFIKKTY